MSGPFKKPPATPMHVDLLVLVGLHANYIKASTRAIDSKNKPKKEKRQAWALALYNRKAYETGLREFLSRYDRAPSLPVERAQGDNHEVPQGDD